MVMMFAVAFEALSNNTIDHFPNNMIDRTDMTILEGFPILGSLITSIANTFYAGVLSYYELDDIVTGSSYSVTAVLLLTALLVAISVISLNALIALIGDAFDRVLAEKNAVLNSERAQIILDMYCMMKDNNRKEIEEKNKWTYRLIPVSVLETMDIDKDSSAEANLARATKDDLRQMNRQLKDLIKNGHKETKAILTHQIKEELREELTNTLKSDFDDLKRIIFEQQQINQNEMNSFKNDLKNELQGILQAIHSSS